MPNPLVNTRMVWDPDINPEGLAEQWKHTFVFGAERPPPPSVQQGWQSGVAPKPPEPFLKLDLFANFAQFVYDDANPENPLGARATTTANGGTQLVPNTDAFLLAWQVGARLISRTVFTFKLLRHSTITPATATRLTFIIRAVSLSNQRRFAGAKPDRHQQPADLRHAVEFGWKPGECRCAYLATSRPISKATSAPMRPVIRAGQPALRVSGWRRYRPVKKKHDWQLDVWYQHIRAIRARSESDR